jgi:hypothetical protein
LCLCIGPAETTPSLGLSSPLHSDVSTLMAQRHPQPQGISLVTAQYPSHCCYPSASPCCCAALSILLFSSCRSWMLSCAQFCNPSYVSAPCCHPALRSAVLVRLDAVLCSALLPFSLLCCPHRCYPPALLACCCADPVITAHLPRCLIGVVLYRRPTRRLP